MPTWSFLSAEARREEEEERQSLRSLPWRVGPRRRGGRREDGGDRGGRRRRGEQEEKAGDGGGGWGEDRQRPEMEFKGKLCIFKEGSHRI